MKKIFCILTLLLTAFLIGCSENSQSSKEKEMRIAILTPTTHPSLEQIENGFIETLNQEFTGKFNYKTYNAQGSKTLMRAEVEEILNQKYDLIFAIGSQAAQMSREVAAKKKKSIPIVFSAVSNPLELNLVSDPSQGIYITGIEELTDFEKELSILPSLNKNIKKVVLVYDPTLYGLEENRKTIAKILTKLNILLVPVEVFRTNEIMQKVAPFITDTDVVMVLKDNTVVPGLEALVKLCSRNKIILLASDLDSIDHGATVAYGANEYAYGTEAAKKALLILNANLSASEIPISPLPSTAFIFKFNQSALLDLGITEQGVIK